MPIQIEVTDTFSGEANYCWVRRYTITDPKLTNLQVVRRAKRLAGWNGVRCKREVYGDMMRLTPYGICQTMFIHLWEA